MCFYNDLFALSSEAGRVLQYYDTAARSILEYAARDVPPPRVSSSRRWSRGCRPRADDGPTAREFSSLHARARQTRTR